MIRSSPPMEKNWKERLVLPLDQLNTSNILPMILLRLQDRFHLCWIKLEDTYSSQHLQVLVYLRGLGSRQPNPQGRTPYISKIFTLRGLRESYDWPCGLQGPHWWIRTQSAVHNVSKLSCSTSHTRADLQGHIHQERSDIILYRVLNTVLHAVWVTALCIPRAVLP